MSWREKRKVIPGGCDGVYEEIALSAQQIGMVADPWAPIRGVIPDVTGGQGDKMASIPRVWGAD